MLSSAQNATYVDLNVDEMLPYYSMNAAEQGEDGEVTEEDLPPPWWWLVEMMTARRDTQTPTV